ncbi:gliding motility-associated C-terminal domain-containing protein [Flavobacterium sp. GT3P67]|uniref:gliding motility-associated C-terminal domain-containing protein n=1 Tax=Flavobacterium sp. GT3P67 TaxID=2541722 RepID=UPI001048B79E|nr:gliding motility-associated C-terminal domain-containing protein [Flavobacterium sp. GT3P67]TDE48571.1 gliding motility-associated C-terminal domain-containing protein [Flavobacterium sp. GT3P67]
MKKIITPIFMGISLLLSPSIRAQLAIESEGIFIKKETLFYTEGLTLIPSHNVDMNNQSITVQARAVIWPKLSSIQLMYQFSRPMTFAGELGFNYKDVALNDNDEKNLVLAYTKAVSNNYKDFELVKGTSVKPDKTYISYVFGSAINLSSLTAVSMESSLTTPYTELEANNLITPNGDGINDFWIVKNMQQYPNNELYIFDRDGREVFTMNGYDNSWNGMSNGNPLPEGTYYYILSIDSGKSKKSGFVSIVKE